MNHKLDEMQNAAGSEVQNSIQEGNILGELGNILGELSLSKYAAIITAQDNINICLEKLL